MNSSECGHRNLAEEAPILGAPELTIVVPTFNERTNLAPLVLELREVMQGITWEIVFVDDDSPDQTAAAVRELSRDDRRVRCVQRIGRRGLSSACIEGILNSSSPYVTVMDGDLQHDSRIIPKMLELMRNSDADVVVGSRYTEGGSIGAWSRSRALVSRAATRIGRSFVPEQLKDPMSGFFTVRRSFFDQVVHRLSGVGFKILLDIFASSPRPVAFREVPFEFRTRLSGDSKLDSQVAWEYLMLLLDKLVGKYVPTRFVMFGSIGALGLLVHMAILATVYRFGNITFVSGQAVATFGAMIFNYSLNNWLTYRDKRRKGWRWLTGLVSFVLACSVGAVANVGIAVYIFNRQSGWVLAAIAGVATGAVWNFAVTSTYTWGRPK